MDEPFGALDAQTRRLPHPMLCSQRSTWCAARPTRMMRRLALGVQRAERLVHQDPRGLVVTPADADALRCRDSSCGYRVENPKAVSASISSARVRRSARQCRVPSCEFNIGRTVCHGNSHDPEDMLVEREGHPIRVHRR